MQPVKPRSDMRERLQSATAFFQHEVAGGLVLLAAAIAALIVNNSPLDWLYDGLLEAPVAVRIGALALDKPLLLWINDGLMAVFFFLVGLEIKRELLQGELSTVRLARLPAIAAVGGMVVPALIYVAVNADNAAALKGWAIPSATDIAFAVGVLALLGPRVPPSLKVFLLALAILDDLGAILIIAAFYTANLHWLALLLAAAGGAVLLMLNLCGVTRLAPYLLAGIFIWVCVLKSGVHATLAGVAVAIAIPLRAKAADEPSLLEQLEERLYPWVAFGILPLFAFANAGVSLAGMAPAKLLEPVPLGIVLGLCIGKPIGILGATGLAVASGLAARPQGASWTHLLGVGMLGGIGFTMSLFIGMLAFSEPAHAAQLRLGVLAGSVLSAVAGYLILRFIAPALRGSPG
jgi:Na+:H+ antiporter, NhaA family